jgi:hypothetical protein
MMSCCCDEQSAQKSHQYMKRLKLQFEYFNDFISGQLSNKHNCRLLRQEPFSL